MAEPMGIVRPAATLCACLAGDVLQSERGTSRLNGCDLFGLADGWRRLEPNLQALDGTTNGPLRVLTRHERMTVAAHGRCADLLRASSHGRGTLLDMNDMRSAEVVGLGQELEPTLTRNWRHGMRGAQMVHHLSTCRCRVRVAEGMGVDGAVTGHVVRSFDVGSTSLRVQMVDTVHLARRLAGWA